MKPLQLLLLSAILFSCSKSSNGPTPVPPGGTPKDSLGNWKVVDSISAPNGIYDIWFTSPSQGFTAVSDGYLYKSQDSGKTWTKISNTNINPDLAINLFFVGDKYGFAQGLGHLLVSQDGGNTWVIRPLPIQNAFNEFFVSPSTGYCGDVTTGLYKTTDTGKTWTQSFHSSRSPASYITYFLDPGKGFLFCGDATFSKTTDSAASWQQVQKNIFVTSNVPPAYNSLQFIDSQTGYYGWENGVLKTTDGGVSWSSVYPTGGRLNVVKFFNATTGYYKSDKIIYKTTDGGQTWTTSCRFISDDYFIGINFVGGSVGWACTAKGLVLRIDQP